MSLLIVIVLRGSTMRSSGEQMSSSTVLKRDANAFVALG